jgi:hypothetical protein
VRKTKYMPSGGLAFYEEKEMKKLSELAKQGWILEGFSLLGFKLRKGEPMDIDYSLDYQKDADDEYFAFFEEAGWSHVCTAGDEIHIFRAPAGITPIYSDKPTIIEKYEREKRQMGRAALPFLISAIFFFALSQMSRNGWLLESLWPVFVTGGILSLAVLVFPGLPYLSYLFKLNKLRKTGL